MSPKRTQIRQQLEAIATAQQGQLTPHQAVMLALTYSRPAAEAIAQVLATPIEVDGETIALESLLTYHTLAEVLAPAEAHTLAQYGGGDGWTSCG